MGVAELLGGLWADMETEQEVSEQDIPVWDEIVEWQVLSRLEFDNNRSNWASSVGEGIKTAYLC
jgi:hypothetical protein